MDDNKKNDIKRLLFPREWVFKKPDKEAIQTDLNDDVTISQHRYVTEIAKSLDSDAGILSRVMKARGYSRAEAQEFLSTELGNWRDPYSFRDMAQAVDLILRTLKGKGRILIFGDYDADGLTASSILKRWFASRSHDCDVLIPNRLEDGYGLTQEQADRILALQPDLVITVDCGSSSIDEVKLLKDHGIKVIVTDHHSCADRPHTADCHINPNEKDCGFPFSGLSGSGVAWHLVRALSAREPAEITSKRLHAGAYSDYRFAHLANKMTVDPALTVLAAIGTVADVMPLTDENRRIVAVALELFAEYAPAGLKAVCRQAGRNMSEASCGMIQFAIAPRLNAAGRLGQAGKALQLLLTDDEAVSGDLSEVLESLNSERRELEQAHFLEAVAQIESAPTKYGRDGLVMAYSASFHPGVVGIVSSRLVERYRSSAITFALEHGLLRGSGRGFGNDNILFNVSQVSDKLITYGGHAGALGLSLK